MIMRMLFAYLVLITCVCADMHGIALRTLASSAICRKRALFHFIQDIASLQDKTRFNNDIVFYVWSLTRDEESLDPELVFESVLTFLNEPESPLCHFLSYKSIGSLNVFISAIFNAFNRNAQLENFAHLAYSPNDSILMRFYFSNKQIELAKFFVIYSKHAIAQVYSFRYVLEMFLNAKLKVYSCPELIEKLTQLFDSKEFATKVEYLGSDKERLNYLFFNHLFNDEQLMLAVFGYLLKFKQFDFMMSFKSYFMRIKSWPNCFEFRNIIFCTTLLKYEFNLEKIRCFTSLLIRSNDEWDHFLRVVFSKHAIKKETSLVGFHIDTYICSCNEVFGYVTGMFESSEPRLIAENLVRHFRRALYGFYQLPSTQVTDEPELIKKFIARLVQVYGVDLEEIKEEFPKAMRCSAFVATQDEKFWKHMQSIIDHTVWK